MTEVLASELIAEIREWFKPFSHDGVSLDAEHVCDLLVKLRSIEEIARDTEEDKQILAELLRIAKQNVRNIERRAVDITNASNVVTLPIKRRPSFRVVVDHDGGPSCA